MYGFTLFLWCFCSKYLCKKKTATGFGHVLYADHATDIGKALVPESARMRA